MKISKRIQQQILCTEISTKDLEKWRAFEILKDAKSRLKDYHSGKLGVKNLKNAKDFAVWTGMQKQGSSTLEEIFDLKINSHFILWTILREEIIPKYLLHYLADYFCRDFLARLKEENVYINYQYTELLDTKLDWAFTKASYGQLTHAQREGDDLLVKSYGTQDEKMIAAAEAMHLALHEDGRLAILGVFKTINKIYEVKEENECRLATIKEMLADK